MLSPERPDAATPAHHPHADTRTPTHPRAHRITGLRRCHPLPHTRPGPTRPRGHRHIRSRIAHARPENEAAPEPTEADPGAAQQVRGGVHPLLHR
ncbi:hypothetical protein ALMP_68470 [Streptomyces sp. A012304]|nr:hypothetical protein ALMP_68470 [Streptomyces sp. A012304]